MHETTPPDSSGKDTSVKLIRMYYDTTSSPPPALDVTDSSGPIAPRNNDNDQPVFKDDMGSTAEDAVNDFFNAFNNNGCHIAWNMTYNNYWVSQGEGWFCSPSAFGGVSKVVIKSLTTVVQNEQHADIYADYYAEDIYNGNKCFKQTLSLQKMTYSDDKSRWTITKMKNNVEPVTCSENQ